MAIGTLLSRAGPAPGGHPPPTPQRQPRVDVQAEQVLHLIGQACARLQGLTPEDVAKLSGPRAGALAGHLRDVLMVLDSAALVPSPASPSLPTPSPSPSANRRRSARCARAASPAQSDGTPTPRTSPRKRPCPSPGSDTATSPSETARARSGQARRGATAAPLAPERNDVFRREVVRLRVDDREDVRAMGSLLERAEAAGAAERGVFVVETGHLPRTGQYAISPASATSMEICRSYATAPGPSPVHVVQPEVELESDARSFCRSDAAAGRRLTQEECLDKFEDMVSTPGRPIPGALYRTDLDAETPEDRLLVGLPERSTVWPLSDNGLMRTVHRNSGIHGSFAYEASGAFGAAFTLHTEDCRLYSLHHLHAGRKIWLCVPPAYLGRLQGRVADSLGIQQRQRCSQTLRHSMAFITREQLASWDIPYTVIDQTAGDIVVTLPDTAHQGFSPGFSLGEAVNYAGAGFDLDEYVDCKPTWRRCAPSFEGGRHPVSTRDVTTPGPRVRCSLPTRALLSDTPEPEKIVMVYDAYRESMPEARSGRPGLVPLLVFLGDEPIRPDHMADFVRAICISAGADLLTGSASVRSQPPARPLVLPLHCDGSEALLVVPREAADATLLVCGRATREPASEAAAHARLASAGVAWVERVEREYAQPLAVGGCPRVGLCAALRRRLSADLEGASRPGATTPDDEIDGSRFRLWLLLLLTVVPADDNVTPVPAALPLLFRLGRSRKSPAAVSADVAEPAVRAFVMSTFGTDISLHVLGAIARALEAEGPLDRAQRLFVVAYILHLEVGEPSGTDRGPSEIGKLPSSFDGSPMQELLWSLRRDAGFRRVDDRTRLGWRMCLAAMGGQFRKLVTERSRQRQRESDRHRHARMKTRRRAGDGEQAAPSVDGRSRPSARTEVIELLRHAARGYSDLDGVDFAARLCIAERYDRLAERAPVLLAAVPRHRANGSGDVFRSDVSPTADYSSGLLWTSSSIFEWKQPVFDFFVDNVLPIRPDIARFCLVSAGHFYNHVCPYPTGHGHITDENEGPTLTSHTSTVG